MEPWSLFPGVYSWLVDTSYGVEAANTTTGFICFMSERGPDNQLTLNGRVDDFLNKYGTIDIAKYGQGQKIATEFLTYANSLYAIRVTPDASNCAAMDTIYKGLYGNYRKSAIEMREASYANLGLAINASGDTEFIYVGPEDLGTIISRDALTPPSSPVVGDKYFIPLKYNEVENSDGTIEKQKIPATGAWANYENCLATCIYSDSNGTVRWSFKEIQDTSTAVIGNSSMTLAVTYDYLEPVAFWMKYDNSYLSSDKYALVKDIIYKLPEDAPEDGDAYLICENPDYDDFLQNHNFDVHGYELAVIVYVADLDEWHFERYNRVFVEKDYVVANDEPSSKEAGDRLIVGDSPTLSEWVGHEDMIVEWDGSNWKLIQFSVDDPEDTDGFQSLVLDQYVDEQNRTRIEYKKIVPFVKNIIWTDNENAKFPAYAHRMSQFDDIVTKSDPNTADATDTLSPFVIFYPKGRGSWYNTMHINMSLSKRSEFEEDSEKTLILDVYITKDGNKLKAETFEVSFNPRKKMLSGESMFIKDVVEKYSNYINVAIDQDKFNESATFNKKIHESVAALFTKYAIRTSLSGSSIPPALQHGDDGSIFDSNGELDWSTATSLLYKAYCGTITNPASKDVDHSMENGHLNREEVLLDLVFDAGYPVDVKVAIQTLIDARHNDCFGIIDMGDNVSASAALAARTSEGGVGKPFNTPYIAIYEPYTLVYDQYSGRDVWMSPVFHAVRAYALTDLNYGRHQAPAGAIRGICPKVKKLRYNLNRETEFQDSFMTYNINPIIMNRDGYVIWNQSTS